MNKVYTHPGQPQMQVEVILASKGTNGAPPIYSVRMRYPRPIHGEIMTHRDFSRNARSSRAVPVLTMLNEVRSIPYIPWHWGANQKGMQADEECNAKVIIPDWDDVNNHGTPSMIAYDRVEAWLKGRDAMADLAEAYMKAGYHKQNPNRLLEPFSWMDTLITSTKWANFLWLRDHEAAEPHLHDLAVLVDQALKEADVQELKEGEWHLPYITAEEVAYFSQNFNAPGSIQAFADQSGKQALCKLSAARCARISYKPFDGDAAYEREMERYNGLVKSDRVHASPLEHAAQVDTKVRSSRTTDESGWVNAAADHWAHPFLSGNLSEGWVQFRKTVPNECHHG